MRVKFNDKVLSGILYLFLGFKKLVLSGVVVFICLNMVLRLKLNFENMMIEMMSVLVISKMVLII